MISLDSISFGYLSNEAILSDVSWEFMDGSSTAITGVSGRGKSTLLYLVGQLLSPWSGTIWDHDRNLSRMSDREASQWRATRVGFVFQDAALDPTRTVLDNVLESSLYNRLSRGNAVDRAQLLMKRFGVLLRADHRPGEVSGGQAQRIALCRALLSDPQVILADEPTGNLDSHSAGVVLDALFDAASVGRIVVIATHDEEIVAKCDRVLAL